jgi:hypothetical protein
MRRREAEPSFDFRGVHKIPTMQREAEPTFSKPGLLKNPFGGT